MKNQGEQELSGQAVEPPIAALSGRELVAAVGSRVMGWRVFDINDVRSDEWRTNRANYPYLEQYRGTALYTSETERRLWNPDTDIAAAMQVVEKMRGDKWDVQITSDDESPAWYVSFDARDEAGNLLLGESSSDSLPDAICRAALEAKGI